MLLKFENLSQGYRAQDTTKVVMNGLLLYDPALLRRTPTDKHEVSYDMRIYK
jgi:hypothetical protein